MKRKRLLSQLFLRIIFRKQSVSRLVRFSSENVSTQERQLLKVFDGVALHLVQGAQRGRLDQMFA
ncbi:hypothetical protein A0123_00417 [Gluconobacter cerinus]|uniref:Uncharacterized protein n=1 Tax=Gluconobacter cerinus TaxID=38307 RepID=A0A1B6VNQ7_9PROT|nr:hypothetical protein A0123_00417 [Gluconobacter cerinus]